VSDIPASISIGLPRSHDPILLQPQVIPGALSTGAVGTAFLGPSPDGTCRAVFCVVTADGSIVQEHVPDHNTAPRLGVIMNPYVPATQAPVVQQLFVSEPFNNTIAVIDLGTSPNQIFAPVLPNNRTSSYR